MQLEIATRLDNDLPMNLRLQSPRLNLVPFTRDDLDLSLELFTDPEVVRYAGSVMSAAEIEASVSNWTRRGGNGCVGIWTISDRVTGEKYGSAALFPMPVEQETTDYALVIPGEMPDAEIEIGYYLKRSAWGFGYATEASRRLLEFAFQQTSLQEVVATFHKDNLASRHVLLKAGFRDCGTMLCYGKVGLNFRITRDEWTEWQSGDV